MWDGSPAAGKSLCQKGGVGTHRRGLYAYVKAFVRWATGKKLTNRLPKLSLITLSPPSEQRGPWSSYGPYVPSPKFLTISGDPGGVIYQILHEGIHFSFKSVYMVDVRVELASKCPWY